MKRKLATIVAFCCFALVFAVAFACASVIMIGVQAQAETIKSRIGELSFTHSFANGYPTDATVEKLFNEMDFQRAVQAYIWSIPLVSMALLKKIALYPYTERAKPKPRGFITPGGKPWLAAAPGGVA